MKFRHVDFTYPGSKEAAITDIDFTANPGQTTAIIGSTGCGKSTIVNLIPRLYDVDRLEALALDGTDIRELLHRKICVSRLALYRRKVCCSREPSHPTCVWVIGTPVMQMCVRRLEIAQAEDFIEEKSEKYDAPIAQGGTNVSGGSEAASCHCPMPLQRHPKILCLTTAFLHWIWKTDARTEKSTCQIPFRTCIGDHRGTAYQHDFTCRPDPCALMKDRSWVKAPHEELMKTCTVYQEIAKSQMSAKELGLTDGEEA
ncbi:MAG: ATP-binding cassette domain-containing protein [Eubacterium ramulus]